VAGSPLDDEQLDGAVGPWVGVAGGRRAGGRGPAAEGGGPLDDERLDRAIR
jgi:hypothetical protein